MNACRRTLRRHAGEGPHLPLPLVLDGDSAARSPHERRPAASRGFLLLAAVELHIGACRPPVAARQPQTGTRGPGPPAASSRARTRESSSPASRAFPLDVPVRRHVPPPLVPPRDGLLGEPAQERVGRGRARGGGDELAQMVELHDPGQPLPPAGAGAGRHLSAPGGHTAPPPRRTGLVWVSTSRPQSPTAGWSPPPLPPRPPPRRPTPPPRRGSPDGRASAGRPPARPRTPRAAPAAGRSGGTRPPTSRAHRPSGQSARANRRRA